MAKMMTGFVARLREFARARRGNVAMMFALSLVPLVIAGGVGLDLARGMMVRSAMSEALDAAALAIGSSKGLDRTTALSLAQKYFDANYKGDASYGTPVLSIGDTDYSAAGSVKITATDTMPTTLMKIAGFQTIPISTATTVVWGQNKLWVALVLDNSGSMAQGDSSGSKMDALHNAGTQLLTTLQNASASPGDVQVSIVPFDRTVNVGKSNVSGSWVGWTPWEAAPATPGTDYSYNFENPANSNADRVPFSAFGPGDYCPFVNVSTDRRGNLSTTIKTPFGFGCLNSSTNSTSTQAKIPSSGLICPGLDDGGHGNSNHRDMYYNGCYTSTEVSGQRVTIGTGSSASCTGFVNSCTCTGNYSSKVCTAQKWTHAWVANDHSTWGGCIMDRDQDYDIANTAPSGGGTLFPAVNPSSCLSATVTTLGYSWTDLSSKISAMKPSGSTNQAEGMAHGWQSITTGNPYGAPALPANTARYIILLSDGLNTQDRWWGNGYTEGTTEDGYIDDREKKTCDAAKADGVIIYTIFLDIGGAHGDSAPLEYCASDSSKYFDLTTTSAVVTTFNQIAQQITNVRVSR
jgi:Flp pilus assembly protein TadG